MHILKNTAKKMLAQGCSEEETALFMYNERRRLGKEYKLAAPPLLREYIYFATAAKYGDPLGPSFEDLKKHKTYREIISSASRPIDDLDNRLTIEGFKKWYMQHYAKERK